MLKYVSIYLMLGFLTISTGQTQNILVLEKPGTTHNYKYYADQHLHLQLKKGAFDIGGAIGKISDSSIIFSNGLEVLLNDIGIIYRNRWGFRFLNRVLLTAGIAYLSISTLNGLINADQPVVPSETLIISGSLIASGLLLKPLITRKYKLEDQKWRLVILDFSD
ncbi:MAG: hypothetical protein KQI35_05880 [Bacteroidetes bacterium]|nr:hypothetical protein [Bacteroidota bacterium]